MVCRLASAMRMAAVFAAICAADAAAEDERIAGVQPDQRPADAPTIEQVVKSNAWYARALTGIDRPYPYSLRFLEDQGNWYTPFSRHGSAGRYDIRGWHQEKQEGG